MMTNSKVAVDSFMCLGALSYNHTKERLLLMYKPIKRIIWDFDVGFQVARVPPEFSLPHNDFFHLRSKLT